MTRQLHNEQMNADQAIIIKFIKENLLGGKPDVQLSPEDDLLGSGFLDSMGVMRLVSFVEDQFQINIPTEDIVIENFLDVNAITNYVKKLVC